MGSNKDIQLLGCFGKHGSYSFFKSIKIAGRSYSISSHFPVRIWPDSTILSIAEVQLLWTDRAESFCSLKLYFLPENTPEGRHQHHGEHEVIALQDKVIIRASDLADSWLVDDSDWEWGYVTPPTASAKSPSTTLSKAFLSEKFRKTDKDPIDFTKHGSSRVIVLNYERYIRLRTVLKRLEGSPELSNWLSHPLVLALGGLNVGPNCHLLFAKEVFDYPELEDHELLCNHLAPKLKGKPNKKRRRKRNPSLGSESNTESETSSNGSCGSDKAKKPVNGLVKIKGDPDELAHRRFVENSIGTKVGVKEEPRDIKKIANKLISSHMENGKMGRTVNNHLRNAYGGTSSPFYDGKGDPEGHLQNDLLELAQKLEKSNALQILPIRPSVIQSQKPDSLPDESVSRKRLKTDSSVNSTDSNVNFRAPQADMDFFARAWNGHLGLLPSIYGPPLIRQSSSKSSKTASARHDGDSPTMKSKVERPVLSITPVHMDGKQTNSSIPLMRLNSPSPFVQTTKIYGDPTEVRKQGRIRDHQSSSAGNSADILDFSFKRRRLNADYPPPPPSAHAKMSTPMPPESELLDLSSSARSQLSSVHGQNKHIFHNLLDIPPPNAMNQLGLRLTSEVTLFPSSSSLAGGGSSHKSSNKVANSSKSHHHSNNQNSSSGSSSSKSKWEDRQHAQGGNNSAYRSTSSSSSLAAHSSSSSSKGYGMNDNKKNHSLESLAAVYGAHKLPAGLSGPSQRTSSSSSSSLSKLHKSDHQQFSVPPSAKDRLSLPGNSLGLAKSASSKEREKSRADGGGGSGGGGGSSQYRNNHQQQQIKQAPQLHPQFFPKIDPAYLHLFGAPMFMPQLTSAHPGGSLMDFFPGVPPGTMEQLQMYLQASQLTNWPFEAAKTTERGPK